MIQTVRATLEQYHMAGRGDTVLAAVSGGADSVAMLHILYTLAPDMGFTLRAAHYNHMLRIPDADADEQYVVRLCAALGVELETGRGDVAAMAAQSGESTELCARNARYAFLRSCARGARIATAHTKNDSAETVLFNLTRGTGPAGLCGIPAVRGDVIRPVIRLTREQTEEWCHGHGLEYVTDSTNFDVSYSRNRIRANVLPELEKINPAAVDAVCRAGELLAADEAYLSAAADRCFSGAESDGALLIEPLRDLESALLSRVMMRYLRQMCAADPDVKLVRGMCALVREGVTGSRLQITDGLYAAVSYGRLCLTDGRRETCGEELPLCPETPAVFCSRWRVLLTGARHADRSCIDLDKADGPLKLRTVRPGDRYCVPNVGSKPLSRLYIDRRIPAAARDTNPVAVCGAGIVWAKDIGVDARFRADENSTRLYKIEVTEV